MIDLFFVNKSHVLLSAQNTRRFDENPVRINFLNGWHPTLSASNIQTLPIDFQKGGLCDLG